MVKSLRQRLSIFILLPVTMLLLLTGFLGFIYVRGIMLAEWKQASIVKLQRAAHHMDMRLSRIIDGIHMFYNTGQSRGGGVIQEWILTQLRGLKGVTRVDLKWTDEQLQEMPMVDNGRHMRFQGRMTSFHRGRVFEVTAPRYDARSGQETVTLISNLKDESGNLVGTLEVSASFQYLMEDVKMLAWWQTDQACLVDDSGRYLAHTETIMKGRKLLGGHDNTFEIALLKAFKEKPFGTVLGPGHPPDQVAGFYRLEHAPWTLLLFASGKKVLAPIVQFRFYYVLGGIFSILLIILLIRSVVEKMVRSFTDISRAAEKVASGKYSDPLPVYGRDEISQLTRSFNMMVTGLKERDFVRNTFGRYVDQEVAKKLMTRPEASRMGGEKREVAILMSDIRGFTSLSESLSPDTIIGFLNRYFSHMIEIIQGYQGIIVDFFGDSVLAFFDPLDGPVKPTIRRAVQCALDMQAAMVKITEELQGSGMPELQMGIGVNAGEVVVGNIGSEARSKYGIVGSPVNITHRIQSTAKGGQVVISESVHRHLAKDLLIKNSVSISLKGLKEPLLLFLVEDLLSDI
jgi:adenylate cyclase